MSRKKPALSKLAFAFRVCIITLILQPSTFLPLVQCQFSGLALAQLQSPASLWFLTEAAYSKLDNLTFDVLASKFAQDYSFCIRNPEDEWNRAFNYSSDLSFLTACMSKFGVADVTKRFCTAAEVEIYFDNLNIGGYYLKPNRNCNSSHWVRGCEPGWACSIDAENAIDLRNSQDIPSRGSDCDSCCEGFFCPYGITCMIPCPLGSYCPLATFNNKTGRCDPYAYQLPPGLQNHTCGGANMWADARPNYEVFCSAGFYCPTSTQKRPCSNG